MFDLKTAQTILIYLLEFENTPGPQLMGCKILGFIVQFWFLHAFFWMNVMAYDIYKRFKDIRVGSVTFPIQGLPIFDIYNSR